MHHLTILKHNLSMATSNFCALLTTNITQKWNLNSPPTQFVFQLIQKLYNWKESVV